MKRVEVSPEVKKSFVALLDQCGAGLQPGQVTRRADSPRHSAISDTFFDLDRLWHRSECLEQLLQIVRIVATQLEQESRFDTVASIVSAVGSFGPAPWVSILALEMGKSLVLLDEVRFGNLSIYPLTSSRSELLSEKRVLLVKDVILYGSSVRRAAHLIHEHGGQLVALLTLVDRKPSQRQYDFGDLVETCYSVLVEPERDSI
jgi:orotate phosphoribosyltransferase